MVTSPIKVPYICGPLTELPVEMREPAKQLYSKLAGVCEKVIGIRAFVPHEHYDPVEHRDYTPTQVDQAERPQVCQRTSIMVVAVIFPSWGGGIEVEMAFRSDVPVVMLCPMSKMKDRLISRLLLGNPGIVAIIEYDDSQGYEDTLTQLEIWLDKNNEEYAL